MQQHNRKRSNSGIVIIISINKIKCEISTKLVLKIPRKKLLTLLICILGNGFYNFFLYTNMLDFLFVYLFAVHFHEGDIMLMVLANFSNSIHLIISSHSIKFSLILAHLRFVRVVDQQSKNE